MPPDPHLRPFLQDDPDYGDNETLFTVLLEHNGFFTGLADNLEYWRASTEYWDYCCTDTWSIHWIDELLGQMGYQRDGMMNVYWTIPEHTLLDGLVCIEDDFDIVAMINAVLFHKPHYLVLSVDHNNFLKGLRPDILVKPGRPEVTSSVGVGSSGQQEQTTAATDESQRIGAEMELIVRNEAEMVSAERQEEEQGEDAAGRVQTGEVDLGKGRETEWGILQKNT